MDEHDQKSPVVVSDYTITNSDISTSTQSEFGEYVKKSRICSICIRDDHMAINYLRAVKMLTYDEIVSEKGVSRSALDIHFRRHFIIYKRLQDIIDLKENTSQESNDVITRAIEGEIDIFGGSVAIIKAKSQRLNDITDRLKELSDKRETEELEIEEKQEYIMLNKLAEDIENSIMKVQQFMHKKVFPSSPEELSQKVTSYKLSVLSSFVDDTIMTLLEFEKNPEYSDLVKQIRIALSHKVSSLESRILKSGGILGAIDSE